MSNTWTKSNINPSEQWGNINIHGRKKILIKDEACKEVGNFDQVPTRRKHISEDRDVNVWKQEMSNTLI